MHELSTAQSRQALYKAVPGQVGEKRRNPLTSVSSVTATFCAGKVFFKNLSHRGEKVGEKQFINTIII